MSGTPEYRQCVLRQPTDAGFQEYVVYIPVALARVNRRLGIEGKPGWWTVHSVGPVRSFEDSHDGERFQ